MAIVEALSQEFIAAARDAFISDGVETAGIRPETLASWRRSKAAGVAAAGTVSHFSDGHFDHDSALLRAVRPVTADLMRQFHSDDLAMLLIDRNAVIVGRWSTGCRMERRLDEMGSVTGAVFDEAHVGSTGLGTPLEDGVPAFVDGTEHYNSTFDDVIAAGAPIVNPATGVVAGVLDLVSLTGAPPGLMLPLVSRAAREAGELLASGFARQDRALMDSFMRIERRGRRRPMIAINSRLLVANNKVDRLLAGYPHDELWEMVQGAVAEGRQTLLLDGRGSGAPVDALIRVVDGGGAALQLKPAGQRSRAPKSSPQADALASSVRSALPGRSLHWIDAVGAVSDAVASGRPVLITGAEGSGKSALAVTAALLWARDPRLVSMIDASTRGPGEIPAVPADARAVVVDGIDPAGHGVVEWQAALEAHVTAGCRVLLVCATGLPPSVPRLVTVDLPSLAHRVSDIADLVRSWSTRRQRRVSVTPDAVRELERRCWAGNIRELFEVLDESYATATGGRITRNDLRPARGAGPRRRLTYLENVEREAIAALLRAADGRRSDVAKELGISRATLYRKLSALGLGS
ncbi:helix-turn-helix domain-containing protein [Actinomadura graeca]|uniref:Helix-turn-helix domain-containing protein n=1 Tax=Actinomadura graeca TaxID=2750812 RepID=A0ABX8QZN2_9ACTN|nr:helix-turn-helix domain-containing protein [Actinomadura graeca]QXJ24271.1 helix-turn-helix domain-containing protein [Actinomadura graeca]